MIGHILFREGILKNIIEEKIEGKSNQAWPCHHKIKQIMEDVGSKTHEDKKKKTESRLENMEQIEDEKLRQTSQVTEDHRYE